MVILTLNNTRFKNMKPRNFLNNSIRNVQFNKSRSLLQTSILRCTLKDNNRELASSLSASQKELHDLRKENYKLLQENFDILHTGQFRAYNYDNFRTNLDKVAYVVVNLFDEVVKLSNSLLELQNHPFITGENSFSKTITSNEDLHIPDPFIPRDKIQRSPQQNSTIINTNKVNTTEILASKIKEVQEQASHSIHNISINKIGNCSIRKDINFNCEPSSMNETFTQKLNTSLSYRIEPKITKRKNKKFTDCDIVQENLVSNIVKKKAPKSKDPMFSAGKTKTKNKRKNVKSEVNRKPSNKDEYIKNKELDAFHLSHNETINVTLIPPTLNEFKEQLEKKIVKKSLVNEPTNTDDKLITNTDKIISSIVDTKSMLPKPKKHIINNDDDDDFILPKNIITKPHSMEKHSNQKDLNIHSDEFSSKETPMLDLEFPKISDYIHKESKDHKKKPQKLKAKSKSNAKKEDIKENKIISSLDEDTIKITKPKTTRKKKINNQDNVLFIDKLNIIDIELKDKENVDGVFEKAERDNNIKDPIFSKPQRKRTVVNYCFSPINKKKRRNE